MTYYESPTPELVQKFNELGYYPKPADFEPNPNYPEGHKWFGRKRCHAWNTAKGRQCLGLAMIKIRPDFDKCKTHGGRSLRGESAHNYKDGKYSRYKGELPRLPEFLNDPDYLALTDEIALVTVRLNELTETVKIGESAFLWKEAGAHFRELKAAILSGDTDTASFEMNQLDSILIQGNKEWAKWQEIAFMLDTRRKLVDTERKRIEAGESSIRANRALVLFDSLGQANRTVIMNRLDAILGFSVDELKKERLLNAIAQQFRDFVSKSDLQPNNG